MLVSCKDALIFGLCQFGTVLAFPTILQGTFGGWLFIERIHEQCLGGIDEEPLTRCAQFHFGRPLLAPFVDGQPHLFLGILEKIIIIGLLLVVHNVTHWADAVVFASCVGIRLLRADVTCAAEFANFILLLFEYELTWLHDAGRALSGMHFLPRKLRQFHLYNGDRHLALSIIFRSYWLRIHMLGVCFRCTSTSFLAVNLALSFSPLNRLLQSRLATKAVHWWADLDHRGAWFLGNHFQSGGVGFVSEHCWRRLGHWWGIHIDKRVEIPHLETLILLVELTPHRGVLFVAYEGTLGLKLCSEGFLDDVLFYDLHGLSDLGLILFFNERWLVAQCLNHLPHLLVLKFALLRETLIGQRLNAFDGVTW